MGKINTLLFLLFLLTLAFPSTGNAEETARKSAELITVVKPVGADKRIKLLKTYLISKNSVLAEEADTFVKEADLNKIDYRLLPAISGVESGFGFALPYNSYNGWGWGIYGNNVTYFSSWKDAIKTISKELKERYIDEWGAKDVYAIGRIYAADPNWANKVTHYLDDMEQFDQKQKAKTISILF